jgi:hypothetical protein
LAGGWPSPSLSSSMDETAMERERERAGAKRREEA